MKKKFNEFIYIYKVEKTCKCIKFTALDLTNYNTNNIYLQ